MLMNGVVNLQFILSSMLFQELLNVYILCWKADAAF